MTGEVVIVRMEHVRRAHMCSRGARDFFKTYGLSWESFLANGLDANILEATGDARALAVVKVARHGR